jgi:FtsZ-interacting cell division protein ZipA
MKKSIYILALIALFFTACNTNKKSTVSNNMQSEGMNMEATESHGNTSHNHEDSMGENSSEAHRTIQATNQKNNATTEIIDSYLQIKNALVEDNQEKAAKGGKAMLTAFSNFDMTQLNKKQHIEYMDILEDAKEQAEHIVKSPIDHQREHFENLSVDINDLIALLGTDKTLFQSKCPMASDGKGAIWISEYKEIKNPFFGSKMLTCGNVEQQIN